MRKADSREAGDLRAGLDEVGMGPVAGPICAAVAVFPENYPKIDGVNDSKKIPKSKIYELAPIIMEKATYVGIGWAHPRVIDDLGKNEAWRRACMDALEEMPKVKHLWVDGIILIGGYEGLQECMPKADAKIWWVGAASIVAKAVRDLEMREMGLHYYPGYGWATNAGYPTSAHMDAIRSRGPTPYHRMRYLKKALAKTEPEDVYSL